jgi:saccharopine dehydrogenase (NAD+, L-lysine-forming)
MAVRPSGPLTVVILGAAGTIAPAIVADLASCDEVAHLHLLDLRGDLAAKMAARFGRDKALASAVDATDVRALARRIDGVDVLVNASSYRLNLEVMRACLAARCHYLDLGGLYWMTQRQLELSSEFERVGRLAVLGIGSSPGKTNLMAARAVRELDSSDVVQEIEVATAGRDPLASAFSPPYAVQTLLDELTLSPVVLREGDAVEIDPLTTGGEIDFGEPIGRQETIYTLHSELATFGESFGCKAASVRLSLAPALLARLTELAGATPDAVAAATADAAPPSAESVSVQLVRVTARSGRTVTTRAVTGPHFGLGGSVVSTAAPAAAIVKLLARGELTAVGAQPPERCIDPDAMFAELETRGASFSVER